MIPGLWLEWGHGNKVSACGQRLRWQLVLHTSARESDRSRYQQFRNPKVRAHADEVIDRLVSEYGMGYIKWITTEPGIGARQNCDSVGEGL